MGATALCDPWDAYPPTLEITGTGPSVFGPLQLLQLAVIFRCKLWKDFPDIPAEIKGRRKEEYAGREWVEH